MSSSNLDTYLSRKAAETALELLELCPCPIQTHRLARKVPQSLLDGMECDCWYCQGILAAAFVLYVNEHPYLVADFHRPGASAAASPGEKREDDLISPFC